MGISKVSLTPFSKGGEQQQYVRYTYTAIAIDVRNRAFGVAAKVGEQ
jgi:hypothetical protein